MPIGYLLPTREEILSGREDAGLMLKLAQRAEQGGLDSVWVGDSLLARPRFEPLALLAAVAARTNRIALGTAVLVAPLRNPVVLAHSVATVDRLAGGRLILGVGFAASGPSTQAEYAAAGADYAHRAGRLRELMQICRLLWRGQPVTHNGRFWQLQEATLLPRPHRPGGPPLWVGGGGPLSQRLAGELGDGWFPNSPTLAAFRASWQGAQQAAQAAGRAPDTLACTLYATLNLNADAALARQELERFIESYYRAPFAAIAKRQGCFAGSPQACADYLGPFLASGATHVVLRLASFDQATQLQRVVQELLPHLRALGV